MIPDKAATAVDDLVAADLSPAERLAAAYAPIGVGARWRTLLAFDANLRRAALLPAEALASQLRLAWWRDALARVALSNDYPVLQALSRDWTGSPGALLTLIDAWEAVALANPDEVESVEAVAGARANVLAGARESVAAGPALCWTLVTLAPRASNRDKRRAMLERALSVPYSPLPRDLRPLTVLAGLARRAARRDGGELLGDRLGALAAIRLGIFGR